MTALLYGIWKWFTRVICNFPSPRVSYTDIIDEYCKGLEDSKSSLHHRSMFHSGGELCCSTCIPKESHMIQLQPQLTCTSVVSHPSRLSHVTLSSYSI